WSDGEPVAKVRTTEFGFANYRPNTCNGNRAATRRSVAPLDALAKLALNLAHPDLADCVHHVPGPARPELPQLRDNLFRLVSLPCHCSPPGCQRHTSSRTTSMGVDLKKAFKRYPIGYFHIDIAEVRTEEGKLHLFVAIDRTSKFSFAQLH